MAARRAPEVREWTRFVVVVCSRAYRAMLLTLSVLALAPTLIGWTANVVHSGSMEPSIARGDVALGRPFEAGDEVAVGRVYTFQDPGTSRERLLLHRVVELRDDGDYTTAGDANDVTDLTPVTPAHLESRAVLLVPYVGLPVVWWSTGDLARLALWLVLTAGALHVASRRLDGEPPSWWRRRRRTRERRGRVDVRLPGARRLPVAMVAVVTLGLVGSTLTTAHATYTARTRNSANSWTAGQGLQPYVSAVMASGPTGFWLLDQPGGTAITDRSEYFGNGYLVGAVTSGAPGALPGNPGSALHFDGGGARAILTPWPIWPTSSYSLELWFRTTGTTEQFLLGFENGTGSFSGEFNRQVIMNAQGQLVSGQWAAWVPSTITTPGRYNDGQWHHAVVTGTPSGLMSAGQIYVDGRLVATGTTPSVDLHWGHFRLGSGRTGGYTNARTVGFVGDMDAVSLYPRVLSAAEVAAHYAAR